MCLSDIVILNTTEYYQGFFKIYPHDMITKTLPPI